MGRRDNVPDVERWIGALLKLPDRIFFDIMRNYLGELRTPFNKHTLIEELSSFLRRRETQERLLGHVDDTDIKVLTAVHVLGSPPLSRLFTFFEDSMSYLELHYLLLNLQERLLVYVDSHDQRLVLNPFLQEPLEREVIDSDRLFPSRPCDPPEAAIPWPSEALLLALYSYLSGAPDLLKADGGLKKRALEELAAVFPQLAPRDAPPERCVIALSALFRLRLVTNNRGVVSPDHARWRSFAACDSRTRSALMWAAMAAAVHADESFSLDVQTDQEWTSVLEEAGQIIGGVFANLEPGRAFPAETVTRLASCFATREVDRHAAEDRVPLVDSLARLGLLLPVGDDGWYTVNPHVTEVPAREARTAVLEPNFQLTLKPSIEFADGMVCATSSEIRHYDFYSRYELTKRAFVRTLELGSSGEKLVELFERLGESRLPQNVRFSIDSWEREYRSLSLYRGVILTADAERRHLIEHSDAMKPWISRTLAPGVYLLDEGQVIEWSRALRRVGIDPLPPIHSTTDDDASPPGRSAFRAVGRPRILSKVAPGKKKVARLVGSGPKRTGEALTDELLKALEHLDLSPELDSELRARINKKLILFPEQLQQSQPAVEKNEAKGLDYVGKVRLIEQAIHSGSELLEVLERTPKGATRRLLVRPVEVTKSTNELVLHARTLPDNDEVQIKVRKIGLVRKLKSSLYAP